MLKKYSKIGVKSALDSFIILTSVKSILDPHLLVSDALIFARADT
jgi:hypothetical protein